jgi:hypothetical protein
MFVRRKRRIRRKKCKKEPTLKYKGKKVVWSNIGKYKNQTKELCEIAMKINVNAFKYIKHKFQTPEMCLTAVTYNAYLFNYVSPENKTEKLVNKALELDPHLICSLDPKHLSEKLCVKYLEQFPTSISRLYHIIDYKDKLLEIAIQNMSQFNTRDKDYYQKILDLILKKTYSQCLKLVTLMPDEITLVPQEMLTYEIVARGEPNEQILLRDKELLADPYATYDRFHFMIENKGMYNSYGYLRNETPDDRYLNDLITFDTHATYYHESTEKKLIHKMSSLLTSRNHYGIDRTMRGGHLSINEYVSEYQKHTDYEIFHLKFLIAILMSSRCRVDAVLRYFKKPSDKMALKKFIISFNKTYIKSIVKTDKIVEIVKKLYPNYNFKKNNKNTTLNSSKNILKALKENPELIKKIKNQTEEMHKVVLDSIKKTMYEEYVNGKESIENLDEDEVYYYKNIQLLKSLKTPSKDIVNRAVDITTEACRYFANKYITPSAFLKIFTVSREKAYYCRRNFTVAQKKILKTKEFQKKCIEINPQRAFDLLQFVNKKEIVKFVKSAINMGCCDTRLIEEISASITENDQMKLYEKCIEKMKSIRNFDLSKAPERLLTKNNLIKIINADPKSIRYFKLKHQTDDLCRLAVKLDPENIKYINSRILSESDILDIVSKNGMLLDHIVNQTYKICETAVKNDGCALFFVNKGIGNIDQLEKIALDQRPHAIKYVQKPTEEQWISAVKCDGMLLKYCQCQTERICVEAIKDNYKAFFFTLRNTKKILDTMKKENEYLGALFK